MDRKEALKICKEALGVNLKILADDLCEAKQKEKDAQKKFDDCYLALDEIERAEKEINEKPATGFIKYGSQPQATATFAVMYNDKTWERKTVNCPDFIIAEWGHGKKCAEWIHANISPTNNQIANITFLSGSL